MPQRSAIDLLPADIKEWLNKALVTGSFAGYEKLAEALEEKGFAISKSSIHRYGQKFEDVLAATKTSIEQAKVIVDACPDDAGALGEAILRLMQEKVLGLLVEVNKDDKDLPKIGRMVADLVRASVNQKKWMAEVMEKAKTAAEEVTKIAKKGGLSEETIARVEEEILRIAR